MADSDATGGHTAATGSGTGLPPRGTGQRPDPELLRPGIARVILIGFMAAGKTTVGRLLAERLGWRFVDFDEEIVRRSGETVPEIFRQHGESVFRALEARLTAELRSQERAVLAPGGGWVTTPAALEGLPAGTALVWLRVSAEEALRRIGGGADRPLLAGADPLTRARALMDERESLYRRADVVIDVDGRTPAAIADAIVARLAKRTDE